jgi:hypothetical protein
MWLKDDTANEKNGIVSLCAGKARITGDMKNVIVLLTTVDFFVNAVRAVSIFWSALYAINCNLPKLHLSIIINKRKVRSSEH